MRTRYGNFKYKVMPFELINTPTTFRTVMNTILRTLLNQGVVVYLDNILIYTKTMKAHWELVIITFAIHQNKELAVATHKLFFHVKEVKFLRYIINVNGIEMSTRKVEVVRSWQMPKYLKDVQHLLGFGNFYFRFIKNLSSIAWPMTDITHNEGLDFQWGIM
jgi:hypothetical protein